MIGKEELGIAILCVGSVFLLLYGWWFRLTSSNNVRHLHRLYYMLLLAVIVSAFALCRIQFESWHIAVIPSVGVLCAGVHYRYGKQWYATNFDDNTVWNEQRSSKDHWWIFMCGPGAVIFGPKIIDFIGLDALNGLWPMALSVSIGMFLGALITIRSIRARELQTGRPIMEYKREPQI